MEKRILLMDFSGVYREEEFWKTEDAQWMELREISGTNCYCDGSARELLRRKTEDFPLEGIHFLDSGNYHYMSRIWMEKIREPFRLLVFDNHTDMQLPAFGGLLSCGGWIADALETETALREVILVGPDEEAFRQTEEQHRSQVRFFGREQLAAARKRSFPHSVGNAVGGSAGSGTGGELRAFFEEIPTDLPLYLSIDKDILWQEDARTAWSQGDMTAEELIFCLHLVLDRLADRGRLLGIDICGEWENGGEHSVNDRTNQRLLTFFRERRVI